MVINRSSILAIFILLFHSAVFAQTITVSSVFQTLDIQTAPAVVASGPCAVTVNALPHDLTIDAGDVWMDCSNYSVVVPANSSVVVSGSSSSISISGSYSALSVINVNGQTSINTVSDSLYLESTNGTVVSDQKLYASTATFTLINSPFFGERVSIADGLVEASNDGLRIRNFEGAPDFHLINADSSFRRFLIPYKQRLQVKGTNSNFSMSRLACQSFSPSEAIAIHSHLRRYITKLRGTIYVNRRKRIRGKLIEKRCGRMSFRLINGNVPGF